MLARRIRIDEVVIEGAVFPRASVREFRGAASDSPALAGPFTVHPVPLGTLQFKDLTWIDRRGIALAYDGSIDFDAGWLPASRSNWRAVA